MGRPTGLVAVPGRKVMSQSTRRRRRGRRRWLQGVCSLWFALAADTAGAEMLPRAPSWTQLARQLVTAGYNITPTRSFSLDVGRYCRAYTARAMFDGARRRFEGSACLRPDGSWEFAG